MPSGDHQRRREDLNPGPLPRLVQGGTPSKATGLGPGLTKLLFAFTKRHRGKALELDSSHDTMRVLGPRGEELAVVNSEVALDHLLGYVQETTAPAVPDESRPVEESPPRAKAFRVSARGDDGRDYEGLCPAVGRNGIFLELSTTPAPGTQLDMAIASTNDGPRRLRMKGLVAWTCPRSDEFGFHPGVGVTCTWHSPEVAAFLVGAG